ncbi:MAG: hypothetical protein ACI92W_001247 [Paraglaciecola sp.]
MLSIPYTFAVMANPKNSPYSSKETIFAGVVTFMTIAIMYVMQFILDIPSYREDHHYNADKTVKTALEQAKNTGHAPRIQTSSYGAIETSTEASSSYGSVDEDQVVDSKESEQRASDLMVRTNEEESLSDYFERIMASYQEDIMLQLPANTNRTDVVVRYYKHVPDSGKVSILESMSFYLHERPVSSRVTNYESNSLFFGDSVSTRDLQLVAYLLVTNDIPIKQIRPSKFHDSWKSKAIEIGTDVTIKDKNILTLEEIQTFDNPYYPGR